MGERENGRMGEWGIAIKTKDKSKKIKGESQKVKKASRVTPFNSVKLRGKKNTKFNILNYNDIWQKRNFHSTRQ